MFTVKKYKADPGCYTAYSCKSFEVSRDVAGRPMIILDPHTDGAGLPLQTILADAPIYIENAAGKTIEHLHHIEVAAA